MSCHVRGDRRAVKPLSLNTHKPAPAAGDTPAANVTPPSLVGSRFRVGARLRSWIDTLHRNPEAEEEAAEERRQRLLDELSRAVADAPDDVPIRDVIRGLNRHHDD
jgi:hypothetical protein